MRLDAVPPVWYRVRDLDAARRFYREQLGFEEVTFDAIGGWSQLRHGAMQIGLAQGEPSADDGVAHVDVADLRAEADRLRGEGVEVGTVLEIHGEMRLLDVYDPDGNRIQLAEDLS